MRSAEADFAECRRLLCDGSRTFYLASFLLPAAVRDPAIALYAFCRVADDDIDCNGGAEQLARLEQRLAAVYAGNPMPHPVDRAFARVVDDFALPRALPEALLDGLRWDCEERRYETLADVEAYAARVAGSVGAMMAVLMGARSAELLARATDLGVAMQLSNIARDVGEDARVGRLYLPREWLVEAGIDVEAWLAAPRHTPALGRVVLRLLARADELYARADAGIAGLPVACRFGIGAARHCYAGIGHAVARRDGNGVDQRAVVSTATKLALLARAVPVPRLAHPAFSAPVLEANRFLVEAATLTLRPRPGLTARLLAVFELFERLERRDREARLPAAHGGLGA